MLFCVKRQYTEHNLIFDCEWSLPSSITIIIKTMLDGFSFLYLIEIHLKLLK